MILGLTELGQTRLMTAIPMSHGGDEITLDYAVRSTAAPRRWRRRWIILLVIAAVYYLPWCFRRQIGLIAPRANMRYYYFSENESLDMAFYVVYWPMIRLGEVIETARWGASWAIYYRERSFPTAKEMSSMGP